MVNQYLCNVGIEECASKVSTLCHVSCVMPWFSYLFSLLTNPCVHKSFITNQNKLIYYFVCIFGSTASPFNTFQDISRWCLLVVYSGYENYYIVLSPWYITAQPHCWYHTYLPTLSPFRRETLDFDLKFYTKLISITSLLFTISKIWLLHQIE